MNELRHKKGREEIKLANAVRMFMISMEGNFGHKWSGNISLSTVEFHANIFREGLKDTIT